MVVRESESESDMFGIFHTWRCETEDLQGSKCPAKVFTAYVRAVDQTDTG